MEYLIYILVGVVAFVLGRKIACARKGEPTTKEELKKMNVSAQKAIQEKINAREKMILEYTKHKGKITNDEVEAMFCVSDSTARNYLDGLEKDGKLKQIGEQGRGVHYVSE